ncbi:H-NS histone family protein [Paraburkholderia sp. BL10I2N1]|uniref:H-NS histone family protein n=1 Tax=Paraburkholderia sp. BL10I2N1 TaxID=1938796 RepID=UPI00105F41D5|nr:H-NS histone family protein [Paraburkholderia sp. BL10I2N1]TDN62867.1 DNA-binding protein H-NS [Paraburkholderia sp. BL10I2N1]
MASYKQLTAQLEKLHKEVALAREKEVAQAVAEIKQLIADYEITAEELGFPAAGTKGARGKARKSGLPAKYRNPKTGETWSGRGRAPGWLAGKNRERFLVET